MGFCVVVFDIEVGQKLTHTISSSGEEGEGGRRVLGGEVLTEEEETQIAFNSFPDTNLEVETEMVPFLFFSFLFPFSPFPSFYSFLTMPFSTFSSLPYERFSIIEFEEVILSPKNKTKKREMSRMKLKRGVKRGGRTQKGDGLL